MTTSPTKRRKLDAELVKFLPLIDVAKLRLVHGDVLIVRVDDAKLSPPSQYLGKEETIYTRLHSAIAYAYPGLKYIVVAKRMGMELAIKRAAKLPRRKAKR